MINAPDLPHDVVQTSLWIMATAAVLATVFLLASLHLMPWHATRPALPTERQRN